MSRRVLVAEDDPVIVKLLGFLLDREGYTSSFAADGREALELIKTSPPPCLILLDMMLPHLNGLQLVPAIRNKPEWSDVPIIMLTANSTEKDIVRALDAGANDYVLKPFNPQELMARLRRFIRQER